MIEAFYEPDGDAFRATMYTRGPWDRRFQHGGPPSALLAGAMARWGEDAEAYFLTRVSIELLRPVPIATLTVTVKAERMGRSVQRLSATLLADGVALLSATGLRIRRTPIAAEPLPPPDPWPDPDSLARFVFPFFPDETGYQEAVDLAIAHGAWGKTPVGFWARPRVPLIAGRVTSPIERLIIIADAQSGMGVPLDPADFTFVNPDLTVYLEREPIGDWLGFDIRSTANTHGSGIAQSAIRDRCGLMARSAQSLLVAPRRRT
ncbi:MAG: hypothetical protein ACI8RZ_007025 [Myxococcota bacterium]